MEQAVPQPRPECPGPSARARARRAAAFALVFETFAIGSNRWMRLVGDEHVRARTRWRGASGAFLECTRDQHGQPGPVRLDKTRRGGFRRTLTRGTHRSTHSTKAGGISLRTIITRRIRSSRNRVAMPSRAAATVGYRAHASAIPVADPRLIVGITLNMRKRTIPRSALEAPTC
jgi:hypothetical protein